MDYTTLAKRFMEMMHAMHQTAPQKKMNDVMRGEAFALMFVHKSGGDVLPGKISGAMDISTARIAAALNSLERKGLVTRRINEQDRRQILVNLTPEGKRLVEAQEKDLLAQTESILRCLTEEEALAFLNTSEKLIACMRKGSGHKCK